MPGRWFQILLCAVGLWLPVVLPAADVAPPALLRLAEQGNAEAQYAVGRLYKQQAEDGEQQMDWQSAINWFKRSAETGYLHAKFELAVVLIEAPKALQDFEQSIRWMTDAAQQNFNDAINELALFHYQGLGDLEQDCGKALELLTPIMEVYPFARSNAAWIMSTCPDPQYRYPSKAIRLATRSVFEDGLNSWHDLERLAAAFASDGDWLTAQEWQERAVAGQRAAVEGELTRSDAIDRLELYRRRCLWVGPAFLFDSDQPALPAECE